METHRNGCPCFVCNATPCIIDPPARVIVRRPAKTPPPVPPPIPAPAKRRGRDTVEIDTVQLNRLISACRA